MSSLTSTLPLRLWYVVTIRGDYIFAATDELAAKAQSRLPVIGAREARPQDIAYVLSQGGTIPSVS